MASHARAAASIARSPTFAEPASVGRLGEGGPIDAGDLAIAGRLYAEWFGAPYARGITYFTPAQGLKRHD
jgi:hypothetical protein